MRVRSVDGPLFTDEDMRSTCLLKNGEHAALVQMDGLNDQLKMERILKVADTMEMEEIMELAKQRGVDVLA